MAAPISPAPLDKLPLLQVWWDSKPHPGPWNMALDEALLTQATAPTLRAYHWQEPTVSLGYGHTIPSHAEDARPRVRRSTGGGLVEHGEDSTFTLVLPQQRTTGAPRALEFYAWLHRALAEVLQRHTGNAHWLATSAGTLAGQHCFEAPVENDVLNAQGKAAGGALRRTHEGWLYQGSIRQRALPIEFWQSLLQRLAEEVLPFNREDALAPLAAELLQKKYATAAWQRSSRTTAPREIFVYGTLKRGCYNHHYLHGQQYLRNAVTTPSYRLYNLGGYPGMVQDFQRGIPVQGEIWRVDATCLARLDQLEGLAEAEYERVLIPLLNEPSPVEGYVYLQDVSRAADIGGLWAPLS